MISLPCLLNLSLKANPPTLKTSPLKTFSPNKFSIALHWEHCSFRDLAQVVLKWQKQKTCLFIQQMENTKVQENFVFYYPCKPIVGFLPRWLSGKDSTCQCRRWKRLKFNSWVRKIPWNRKWQPTPVFFFRKIPWTEEPGGLQSMESQRVRHDWVTEHAHKTYNASQCSALYTVLNTEWSCLSPPSFFTKKKDFLWNFITEGHASTIWLQVVL